MDRMALPSLLLFFTAILAACGHAEQPVDPVQYTRELAVASFRKGGCGACHTIPDVPGAAGTIGPILNDIGNVATDRIQSREYTGKAKTTEEYLLESIQAPDAFLSPACPAGPCAKGVMPASLAASFSAEEISAMVNYLTALPDKEIVPITVAEPVEIESAAPSVESVELTGEEFDWAKQTFFERCAGCHGTLRNVFTLFTLSPDLAHTALGICRYGCHHIVMLGFVENGLIKIIVQRFTCAQSLPQ